MDALHENNMVTLYEDNAGFLFLHRQGDDTAYDVTAVAAWNPGSFIGDAKALAAGDTADWSVTTIAACEIDDRYAPVADYLNGVAHFAEGTIGIAASGYIA